MKNIFLVIGLLLGHSMFSQAEDGVGADKIVLGMSNAQSGPAAALGTGMRQGAEAYFAYLNKSGGVGGRKIELKVKDDQYEPQKAAENTEALINEKVFALFGYVGTPTSQAVLPLVGKADIPYVAPFTGAESLRFPIIKNVFNVRASYFDETEALVAQFIKDFGAKKFAVFIQDDGYGAAGEAGVNRALRKRDMNLVGKGIYKRNTVDVDAAVADLKKADAEVIIMIGTYKACAAFVKAAKAAGMGARFANVSFVGTAAFMQEGGSTVDGVVISQVMPPPNATDTALVKEYQTNMRAHGQTNFDYTSLEGYAAAKVMTAGLKASGQNITRESFRAAMEHLNTDLGGLKVQFAPDSHSGSRAVFLTVVKGGKAVPVTSLK